MTQEKMIIVDKKNKLKMFVSKGKLGSLAFWIIIIAIMLKPESLEYLGLIKLDKTLDLLKCLIALGCLLACLFAKKKEGIIIFAIAHKLLAVIVTIMLKGDIKLALIYALNAFFFMLIIYWGCDNKDIITALYYVLTTFIIVNLLTIILYPTGMYRTQEVGWEKNWFLGWKTVLPLYTIPEAALSFLFYHNTGKKRHIVVFLIAVIQPFMEGSAGAVISSGVLLVGFLFSVINIGKLKYIFNICSVMIGYILLSYLLIIVNITEKMGDSLFSFFGKDSSLTTRTTVLWPANIQAFWGRPFLGYGYLKQDDFVNIIGGYRAHNMILAIIVSSGIIGAIIFICFIMYLHKTTKRYIGIRAYSFCLTCILALFTAGLIEAYDNIGVAQIVFVMIYFLPLLFKRNDGFNIDGKGFVQ